MLATSSVPFVESLLSEIVRQNVPETIRNAASVTRQKLLQHVLPCQHVAFMTNLEATKAKL
jgi:hypothetical protein